MQPMQTCRRSICLLRSVAIQIKKPKYYVSAPFIFTVEAIYIARKRNQGNPEQLSCAHKEKITGKSEESREILVRF
jgi:hypothetical protein